MKKEEEQDEDMEPKGKVKCDEDEEDSDDEPVKSKKDEHDDLVRKVRFNLENHDWLKCCINSKKPWYYFLIRIIFGLLVQVLLPMVLPP